MRPLPTILCAFVLAWFSALPFSAAAQTPIPAAPPIPSAPAPQFDIAAIHLHQPMPHERSHIVDSNGSFTTVNVTMKAILQWAFDLPESRIVGGPSWLESDDWDIEAKSESSIDMQKNYDPAAARLEKQRMVQALLADRFHLVTHTETRELPIYALVAAKGGPKFLATHADGNKFDRWNNRIELEGGQNTVAVLAEELAQTLGRVVVDQTGIQGRYKIVLNWSPDDLATGSSEPDSGPSIFTAIQEQLGLRLEPQKGPVQVLVIDRVEKPSEN
ncbi:MAG TPA: TIGR03435 family protein [Terracidiphilus sp.]|jgi:uncharacterized protein (TIGR03435 family)